MTRLAAYTRRKLAGEKFINNSHLGTSQSTFQAILFTHISYTHHRHVLYPVTGNCTIVPCKKDQPRHWKFSVRGYKFFWNVLPPPLLYMNQAKWYIQSSGFIYIGFPQKKTLFIRHVSFLQNSTFLKNCPLTFYHSVR